MKKVAYAALLVLGLSSHPAAAQWDFFGLSRPPEPSAAQLQAQVCSTARRVFRLPVIIEPGYKEELVKTFGQAKAAAILRNVARTNYRFHCTCGTSAMKARLKC